jgi:hypothetical protein
MSEAFDIAEFIEKNKARITEIEVTQTVGDVSTKTRVFMRPDEVTQVDFVHPIDRDNKLSDRRGKQRNTFSISPREQVTIQTVFATPSRPIPPGSVIG